MKNRSQFQGVYKRLRDELFNRRKRMLTLLSARNKPSAVFKAVAEEFKVPTETVRKDYYNMKDWLHVVEHIRRIFFCHLKIN